MWLISGKCPRESRKPEQATESSGRESTSTLGKYSMQLKENM